MRKQPPIIAGWIIRHILDPEIRYSALGDFEENYHHKLEKYGLTRATFYYWSLIFLLFPPFLKNYFIWSCDMIKYYLKTAFRNILKHKVYSFINMMGLAVGMASFILITMWVIDELSYDKQHLKSDRIFRLTCGEEIGGVYDHYALSPFAAAPAFANTIPEIEKYVRVFDRTGLFTFGDKTIDARGIMYADPDFFSIFTHSFVQGDPHTALSAPGSLVLTRKSAKRIFGAVSPIGKTVNLNGDGDLKVTAIIDDVPRNSHFQFEYLVSMNTLKGDRAGILNSWLGFVGWSYVLLKEDVNPRDVESKFPAIVKTHVGDHASYHSRRLMLFLQNIKDIYLKSHLRAEMGRNGSYTFVIVFSIIAFFILIIACINFMNLSTAKSSGRDQEVGLRKVFGATRQRLIGQFLIESILLTGLAFIVSVFLIWLCIPTFNILTGKIFHISDLYSGGLFWGILGLILFTGYISGSYPSLYLSSLQPAVVLKGKSGALFKRSSLRNVLVIIQFTISIFLILGTFIVMAQLYFMKNSKLGFDKEHILTVRLRSSDIRSKRNILRQELLKHPDISDISFSSGTPGGNIGSVLTMVQEGMPASVRHTFDVFFTDENFLNTYGLILKKGRNFSDKIESDREGVFLINESAQKKLGWGEETIGKKIGFGYDSPMRPIIGVISDFHHRSLKEPIGPLAIQMKPYRPSYMSIKLGGQNISATLNHVKKTYHKFEKKRELKYFFIDDHLNNLYHSEEKLSRIVSIFAVMAIFIACLGLFGLSSYITEQRTMEIGVRRVMGASVNSIFLLLSRYFLKWIVVANLIAWPLAFIILKSYWLTQFPYRISPNPWMFIFTGICSISIGLLTISFQSIKAAISKPIDSLKYE